MSDLRKDSFTDPSWATKTLELYKGSVRQGREQAKSMGAEYPVLPVQMLDLDLSVYGPRGLHYTHVLHQVDAEVETHLRKFRGGTDATKSLLYVLASMGFSDKALMSLLVRYEEPLKWADEYAESHQAIQAQLEADRAARPKPVRIKKPSRLERRITSLIERARRDGYPRAHKMDPKHCVKTIRSLGLSQEFKTGSTIEELWDCCYGGAQ